MQTQYVARINPEMPAGTPRRIALSWLPHGEKNMFDAEDGFVQVSPRVAEQLKTVHADGERTARGGRGPKLFEVVSVQEAREIVADEERAKLLSRGGNGVIHADLRAAEIVRHAHERAETRGGITGPGEDMAKAEDTVTPATPEAIPTGGAPTERAPRAGRKRAPVAK